MTHTDRTCTCGAHIWPLARLGTLAGVIGWCERNRGAQDELERRQ